MNNINTHQIYWSSGLILLLLVVISKPETFWRNHKRKQIPKRTQNYSVPINNGLLLSKNVCENYYYYIMNIIVNKAHKFQSKLIYNIMIRRKDLLFCRKRSFWLDALSLSPHSVSIVQCVFGMQCSVPLCRTPIVIKWRQTISLALNWIAYECVFSVQCVSESQHNFCIV